MKETLIAPSVLSANFGNMNGAVAEIAGSGAEWIHLDVMDGIFVPNLTFGPKMLADLRPASALVFDAHLMTVHPENLVASFAEAGADRITFHLEASVHAHRLVESIRQLGKAPGISIVPSTPVSLLSELLPFVDTVLVMTVNPGFGGQKLIPECLEKARWLRTMREEKGYHYLIEADGGINRSTARAAIDAGVDVIVAGSAFFSAADKRKEVEYLRNPDEN
jgi:ribulose-phosphate 3-epimerase